MMKRCSRCETEKELIEFYLGNGWCKQCRSEYYKSKSYSKIGKDKQIREDLNNGNRACNKCKEEKNLEEFPKDKKCKLGRARTCKECIYKSRSTPERKVKQKKLRRNWYEKNTKSIIEKQKEYYQENKERLQAYGRQHAKDNPLIYRAARHRRRAAIKNNGRNDLTADQIEWMFNNFPRCVYCGIEGNLTIDHIMPISKGGENTLDNVVPACMSCNSKKRARVI